MKILHIYWSRSRSGAGKIFFAGAGSESFFSLNFNESTVLQSSQMDIIVSYWDEGKVNKRNLTTIAMEAGTSAEEIVDAVLSELDKNFIRKKNLVSVTTDGCSTMLGKDNGVGKVEARNPSSP